MKSALVIAVLTGAVEASAIAQTHRPSDIDQDSAEKVIWDQLREAIGHSRVRGEIASDLVGVQRRLPTHAPPDHFPGAPVGQFRPGETTLSISAVGFG